MVYPNRILLSYYIKFINYKKILIYKIEKMIIIKKKIKKKDNRFYLTETVSIENSPSCSNGNIEKSADSETSKTVAFSK